MTNSIQGTSHKAISWFFNSTIQKATAWYIKCDEREEPTSKNTLPSKTLFQIWWRNQKPSRWAKVKRIQHHQTSFTTNDKGTSLGRKHKRRKRPAENKPKTIKKMVIGHTCHYLKCKWIRPVEWMKTCACIHFHLPHHSAWSPCKIVCDYFTSLSYSCSHHGLQL